MWWQNHRDAMCCAASPHEVSSYHSQINHPPPHLLHMFNVAFLYFAIKLVVL